MNETVVHFKDAIDCIQKSGKVYWYNIHSHYSSAFDLWEVFGLSKDEFQRLLLTLKWIKPRKTSTNEQTYQFNQHAIQSFLHQNYQVPTEIDHSKGSPQGFKGNSHFIRIGMAKNGFNSAWKQYEANQASPGKTISFQLPKLPAPLLRALKGSLPPAVQSESRQHANQVNAPSEDSVVAPVDQSIIQSQFLSRLNSLMEGYVANLTPEELLNVHTKPTESLAVSFATKILKEKNESSAIRNSQIFGYESNVTNQRSNTPKLDQYLIPNNPREHELLLLELMTLRLQQTDSSHSTTVLLANMKSHSLLLVPKNKDIRVNQNIIKTILQSSELNMNMLVKICCRLDREAFLFALGEESMAPPKELTTEQLAALMKEANLSQRQTRTLRRFLHHWLRCRVLPSERKMLSAYSEDGYNPYTNTVRINGKKLYYSYKLPDELLEFHLVHVLQSMYSKEGSTIPIDRVELVIMADHGGGHFRMLSLFLLFSGRTLLHKASCSTGNNKAKKDSVRLMQQTFVAKVNSSIHLINEAKSVIVRKHDDTFLANLSTRDEPDIEETPMVREIGVSRYLNGDIKFLANCLGKERMSGKHCYLCRLSAKEWSQQNHVPGEAWSQTSLKEKWAELVIATENEQRIPADLRNGVTGPALMDSVPLSNVGVPQLHIELGIGKQVLYTRRIENWIVPFFVWFSDDIYELRLSVYRAKRRLRNLLDTNDSAKMMKEAIKQEKRVLAAATKAHKACTDELKWYNDARMIHIEEILLKYNVKRSSCHGGDPEGNACRSLFYNARSCLTEIAGYLIGLSRVFPVPDGEVSLFFEANIHLLEHYDAIVSFAPTIGLSQQAIVECEEHICLFCRLWRRLRYSTSMVKFHLIEDHLLDALKSENSARLENIMEQFHQVASKFEKLSSARDGVVKHNSFANAEKRNSNPSVQALVSNTLAETSRKGSRESSSRATRWQRRVNLLTLPEIEEGSVFDADKYIIGHLSTMYECLRAHLSTQRHLGTPETTQDVQHPSKKGVPFLERSPSCG